MRKVSLAAIRHALSVSFAVVGALAAVPANAYVGAFDGGGRVGDYLDLVSAANASGARTEIAGVCASACTMKLGARNACVHSDAQLWFHAARNPDGEVNALGTLMMMQEYPRAIRAWATSRGALHSTQFTTMSGAQAIALGMPNCERGQPDYAAQQPASLAFSPRATERAPACYSERQEAAWRVAAICNHSETVSYTTSSSNASLAANMSTALFALNAFHHGR